LRMKDSTKVCRPGEGKKEESKMENNCQPLATDSLKTERQKWDQKERDERNG
jgi:hypothetical protein